MATSVVDGTAIAVAYAVEASSNVEADGLSAVVAATTEAEIEAEIDAENDVTRLEIDAGNDVTRLECHALSDFQGGHNKKDFVLRHLLRAMLDVPLQRATAGGRPEWTSLCLLQEAFNTFKQELFCVDVFEVGTFFQRHDGQDHQGGGGGVGELARGEALARSFEKPLRICVDAMSTAPPLFRALAAAVLNVLDDTQAMGGSYPPATDTRTFLPTFPEALWCVARRVCFRLSVWPHRRVPCAAWLFHTLLGLLGCVQRYHFCIKRVCIPRCSLLTPADEAGRVPMALPVAWFETLPDVLPSDWCSVVFEQVCIIHARTHTHTHVHKMQCAHGLCTRLPSPNIFFVHPACSSCLLAVLARRACSLYTVYGALSVRGAAGSDSVFGRTRTRACMHVRRCTCTVAGRWSSCARASTTRCGRGTCT